MSEVLRVAVDCRLMFYRKAGISNYTRRLVQALASLDSPIALRVLLDRRDDDAAWVPSNVKIARTITPAHHRFERFALPLELAQFDFQLLHSPDFITSAGRFKKVITIHDLFFIEHPEAMSEDGKRYYSRVKWSAQKADAIIAVSYFTKKDILRLMPETQTNKVRVVYEAQDPKSFDALQQKSSPLYASSPFALFVGTFEPRKNLKTLLRAMQTTPPDLKLVVVGETGWGNNEPTRLARELNVDERVHFAGRVSDEERDDLYRNTRVFVFPSLSEGFGLPVLEAMSLGAPVICGDAGSLSEIAGDAAVLVDPLDHESLARQITTMWTDEALRAEYARRGLARAKEFSWRKAAEQTLEIYQSVIGNL
jgi:glycosyltransferase involved in cell wall biosynthesis